jgi:alpha-1,3-mannosyltransferase
VKILHIVRQFYPCIGGIEKFVLCLAKEQIKADNYVSVLSLNRNFANGKVLPTEETYENILINRIPFGGRRRYPIALSCVRYLKGYDVIHIHCVDFFIDYLVALKLFHRNKIILSTHGGYFHTKWLKTFKQLYFNTITRLVLLGCDKIIADSKSDYDLFSKISGNVIRIDNGIEVEKYSSVNKDIELGNIIYVGRIDEHKMIDNLIRVTSLLLKKGYAVKLKIIGPDWKGIRTNLEKLSEELGIKNSVIFFGQLSDEDLLKEIVKAHIFVSASEYEAFGISAVEAMASGTPCVLNNIEAFKEFLADENCGFLTDFNDHEKSAEAVSKILNMNRDTYNTMSLNAKKKASQYSWDKVYKKVMNVYEDMLSHK